MKTVDTILSASGKARAIFQRMSDQDISNWWKQYGSNGQACWYRGAPRRAALREMRCRGFSVR